jgi:hypothetical protein
MISVKERVIAQLRAIRVRVVRQITLSREAPERGQHRLIFDPPEAEAWFDIVFEEDALRLSAVSPVRLGAENGVLVVPGQAITRRIRE